MSLKFSVMEYLAEVTSRKMAVKSRKIAEVISHPTKIVSQKSVLICLIHLQRKKYVTRIEDMLTRRNVGYWQITKEGCDHMFEMTGGAMIYDMAKENAGK